MNKLTPEEIKSIAEAGEGYNAEQVASGIPRMRDEMREAGLPEPIFSTDGGFFTVEFKRPQKDDVIRSNDDSENDIVNGIVNSDDDIVNDIVNPEDDIVNDIVNHEDGIVNIKDAVFRLVEKQEGLSASDIAKSIGKSWRTTMRYLNILKNENKIEFRGVPKTGGFFVIVNDIVKSEDDIVNVIVNPENDIVNDIVNNEDTLKDTVFKLIEKQEGLSASDIAKSIGKSWRTTMRYLNILKNENKIEFRGAPKTGGYYLK